MAQIDVTELFSDPDFVDVVIIIGRTTSVNALGENVVTDAGDVSVYGSVQPISGKTMQRVPDSLRTENLMSFWLKYDIAGVSASQYPTILKFGNTRYNIKHIFNWTNFGAGWCEGLCVAEAIVG